MFGQYISTNVSYITNNIESLQDNASAEFFNLKDSPLHKCYKERKLIDVLLIKKDA